jgi:hypothetical protein
MSVGRFPSDAETVCMDNGSLVVSARISPHLQHWSGIWQADPDLAQTSSAFGRIDL